MAGSRDQVVVSVLSGLTKIQASKVSADIIKALHKHAPLGRGTTALGSKFDVGNLLSNGIKQITSGKGV